MGLMDAFRNGLKATREGLLGRLMSVFRGGAGADETISSLEEALLEADVGVEATEALLAIVEGNLKQSHGSNFAPIELMRQEIERLITPQNGSKARLRFNARPWVILLVGVNGSGKTTTAGKLAHHFAAQGKKVAIAAGDTFRAAAIEQVEVWANRGGARLIRQEHGADPGAVVFDAYQSVKARAEDVLIIDTAGRLQDNRNLMAELGKLRRVLSRFDDKAPHEVMLVIDAGTGQNALSQAGGFSASSGLTGLIITKLDGTARGGVVIPIQRSFKIPVEFIGVGEGVEDLLPFDVKAFTDAIFAQ